MSRIMSIDYGRKRTGLAVTDTLQLIAGGLATVPTCQLLDYLKDYTAREPVELFVIGLPKQANNEPSQSMNDIVPFADKLKKTFPNISVAFFDERFTSVLAHRAMLDAGLKKSARQNKALVDEISATIILQSYMESNKTIRL